MKALKISVFALFVSGLIMTSCKKDQDLTTDTPAAPSISKKTDEPELKIKEADKLFERTLKIYDAQKTKSTTLRFRAASKEALDKLALNDLEFTLVNTPAHMLQQTTNPGTAAKEGGVLASKQGASRTNKNENVQMPENAVVVDLPFESKNAPVSIEVRNKNLDNVAATADPAAQSLATTSLYYYNASWHRVQVTNLHSNPVYASFYYHYWGWKYYSGYAYTLYKNGWGYYYNCNYSVGANVTRYGAYYYRVTWWSYC